MDLAGRAWAGRRWEEVDSAVEWAVSVAEWAVSAAEWADSGAADLAAGMVVAAADTVERRLTAAAAREVNAGSGDGR